MPDRIAQIAQYSPVALYRGTRLGRSAEIAETGMFAGFAGSSGTGRALSAPATLPTVCRQQQQQQQH